MLFAIQAKPRMASPDPFFRKDLTMPLPRPAPPVLRAIPPDPVELLRAAFDGPGQPLTTPERWFDRMEGTR